MDLYSTYGNKTNTGPNRRNISIRVSDIYAIMLAKDFNKRSDIRWCRENVAILCYKNRIKNG